MFQKSSDKAGTSNTRQPAQTTKKEKTRAVPEITSMSQIDVTKPISQQDMALISAKNKRDEINNGNQTLDSKKSIPELSDREPKKEEKESKPTGNNKKRALKLIADYKNNLNGLAKELTEIIKSNPKIVNHVLKNIDSNQAGLLSVEISKALSNKGIDEIENKKVSKLVHKSIQNTNFEVLNSNKNVKENVPVLEKPELIEPPRSKLENVELNHIVGNTKLDKEFTEEAFFQLYVESNGISAFRGTGINPIYGKSNLNRHASGISLPGMNYDMRTGKHSPSISREDYETKLLELQERLTIDDRENNFSKILEMAGKAATDEDYYLEFTKDIDAKLTNLEPVKLEDNGVKLSPVLLDRMRRFHKFLVGAKLYKGNMAVIDGARSAERAHRWCLEWVIENDPKNSQSGKANRLRKYRKEVQKNLIMMFIEGDKYRDGEYIVDRDGNPWATTNHFHIENVYIGDKTEEEIEELSKYKVPDSNPEKGDYITPDFSPDQNKDKLKPEEQLAPVDPNTHMHIVKIHWDEVQEFVKAYTAEQMDLDRQKAKPQRPYRNRSKAEAASGFRNNDKEKEFRLPLGNRPGVTNHREGKAMDVDRHNFVKKDEAMIDLIALKFGLIRLADGETWHFTPTGVELSEMDKKAVEK